MSRFWPRLVPPNDQEHQLLAVTAEIAPVPGARVDAAFEHALADTLGVPEVALLHPHDGGEDLGERLVVERRQPVIERVLRPFVRVKRQPQSALHRSIYDTNRQVLF